MSKKIAMLTTIDNPFNPHHNFDEWYNFDRLKGYNTSEYLARIVLSSYDLSDVDQELACQIAIDEIVKFNVLGIYKKIYEDDEDKI